MRNHFPNITRWFKQLVRKSGQTPFWPLTIFGAGWFATPWLMRDSRDSLQQSLLQLMATAHEHRIPLAPLVASFAAEHRGQYRRLLLRLAEKLETGSSVVAALEQTPEILSDDTVLAIRFGSQSGTLSSTYQQLLEPEDHPWRETQARLLHIRVYWFVLACVILLMIVLMNETSGRKLVAMYNEFGLKPPFIFSALQSASYIFFNFLLPVALVVLFASAFLPSSWRQYLRRTFATKLSRPMAELRNGALLKLLSHAESGGRPLVGSLSTLAKYHFDSKLRQQLLVSRNEVEQGAEVWPSLASVKLITKEQSKALNAAPSSQVRAWALRQLANLRNRSAWRRASIALTVAEVGITLLFALLVMWVCVAYFLFLVTMVTSLS
jgi:type II secretory pathway component PulF